MNIRHQFAAVACSMTLMSVGVVQAATIDFGGLPQTNGSPFSGPYVEDGYTVSSAGGQVFEGHVFGNPTPSLVVGSVFDGGPNGTVQVNAGGGVFSLTSFDLIGNNGNADYEVRGFLGGSPVFLFGGFVGSSFATVPGVAGAVDDLFFRLTANGTSLNIDNIVLTTAVPEPETYAMLLAGLGLLGFAARRRKQQAG